MSDEAHDAVPALAKKKRAVKALIRDGVVHIEKSGNTEEYDIKLLADSVVEMLAAERVQDILARAEDANVAWVDLLAGRLAKKRGRAKASKPLDAKRQAIAHDLAHKDAERAGLPLGKKLLTHPDYAALLIGAEIRARDFSKDQTERAILKTSVNAHYMRLVGEDGSAIDVVGGHAPPAAPMLLAAD